MTMNEDERDDGRDEEGWREKKGERPKRREEGHRKPRVSDLKFNYAFHFLESH